MRYVIIGAGAVGGTLGALLAEHGHEVVLLARGAHADAIRERGLRLHTPSRTLTVRAPVVDDVRMLRLRPDDVLVLAVKSQHSVGLLAALAALPVGASETAGEMLPVLCVQNGVGNEREALRWFARVHGVSVMLPATHLHPGEVSAEGAPLTGLLEIGRFPTGTDDLDHAVAADLTGAGVPTTPRDDVMAWKRAKLLRNVANGLDALCGQDPRGVEAEAFATLAGLARQEAADCFAAAGLTVVPDQVWTAHRMDRVRVVPVAGQERAGSSTWQSLARGSDSTEVDHLNGEIVLLGRLHGVATPVNALVQREVARLLTKDAAPGSRRPSDLLAALPR